VRYLFPLGVALLVLVSACGGATPEAIEITALDDPAFNPAEVTVQVGEPVRFVITNPGEDVHEFVLGPENIQRAHEEASQMGEEHGEMHVEGQLATLELQPGETKEVTVTFEEAGEILYGCHEPGHYNAGMVGTVIVED
jgi:uncharacterized cupredoxin-like copper-binding protein